MAKAFYITHPQVRVDPQVPVPLWGLSALGRARAHAMLKQSWAKGISRIVSSAEIKAVETAEFLSIHAAVPIEIRERMHENDRSATGFLPPDEFEKVADAFFAKPRSSIRGWEKAIDAQNRIVAEVDAVLAEGDGNVAFVGHGAVGTLLMLKLADERIARSWDQPAGGGHYFAFERTSRLLLHKWRRIDEGGQRR